MQGQPWKALWRLLVRLETGLALLTPVGKRARLRHRRRRVRQANRHPSRSRRSPWNVMRPFSPMRVETMTTRGGDSGGQMDWIASKCWTMLPIDGGGSKIQPGTHDTCKGSCPVERSLSLMRERQRANCFIRQSGRRNWQIIGLVLVSLSQKLALRGGSNRSKQRASSRRVRHAPMTSSHRQRVGPCSTRTCRGSPM